MCPEMHTIRLAQISISITASPCYFPQLHHYSCFRIQTINIRKRPLKAAHHMSVLCAFMDKSELIIIILLLILLLNYKDISNNKVDLLGGFVNIFDILVSYFGCNTCFHVSCLSYVL